MAEDKKHLEDEQKEVTSTQQQQPTNSDEQQTTTTTASATADKQQQQPPKEKVIQPLPDASIKQSNDHFKLFSFAGDNSKAKIVNWIRMYENLAKRSKWSDEEMKWNLASYLEHEAFDYYVEHVLINNPDWKTARQSMINRFDQYELEPFMEFLSLKWSPQIELKEYFKNMRALGFAANLKEEEILTGLTRGLPVHLRTELQFVTSLQQWVAIAFCLQQRLDDHGSHYNKQSWKNGRRGGRNTGGRQQNNNKPRTTHQSTTDTLQNPTGSTDA